MCFWFLISCTSRQMETNRLVFQVSPSPPLVASDPRPAALHQRRGQLFGSGLVWGGRKYEQNKDGCLSSRGQHDTLITSRSPPSHPSSPDAQKQPDRNLRIITYLSGLHVSFSSHPSPSSFSPFSFPSSQLSTLSSSVPVLTLCVCVTLLRSHSLCVPGWRQIPPPGHTASVFQPKSDLPPCNENRSSVKRTQRWRDGRTEGRGLTALIVFQTIFLPLTTLCCLVCF